MRRTQLSEIRDTLLALDIPRGRTVIVHSSLVKFGLLEGGAPGVMDVLLDVLGPDATIVMPEFTLSFGASREFCMKTSKSEMGALTEYMRKLPEARRSLHPLQSVSAIGPLRDDVVSGFCLSSFGPDSPFDRLYELDALNLSIGTEFVGGASFLHMGEERLRVPHRFMKAFPGTVLDEDGKTVDETFEMFVRSMTDEYHYLTNWNEWWDELYALDCFKIERLAGGMFCLTEIRRTLDLFSERLEADPFHYCYASPLGTHH